MNTKQHSVSVIIREKSKIRKVANISKFLNIIVLSTLLGACSMMSQNTTSSVENVPKPPQNLNPNNVAAPVVVPPGNNNGKPNASAAKSSKLGPTQRIQEQKSYGGEVEEVKVNNINKVPPYYIYPKQSGVDANAPSSDTVSTPNWKVSW